MPAPLCKPCCSEEAWTQAGPVFLPPSHRGEPRALPASAAAPPCHPPSPLASPPWAQGCCGNIPLPIAGMAGTMLQRTRLLIGNIKSDILLKSEPAGMKTSEWQEEKASVLQRTQNGTFNRFFKGQMNKQTCHLPLK